MDQAFSVKKLNKQTNKEILKKQGEQLNKQTNKQTKKLKTKEFEEILPTFCHGTKVKP